MTVKSYNLNSDFGFTAGADNFTPYINCNGGIRSWQATHPTDTFEVTIAAGTYNETANAHFLSNGTTNADAVPTYDFTLNGNGAVFTYADDNVWLGGTNPELDTLCSYIETVSAGVISIRLRTAGEYTRFPAGSVVEVSGLAIDHGGWPNNEYYFEHVTIADNDPDSNGNGRMTITTPLVNSYRQDWPYYGQGKTKGGPAMIAKKWPNLGMPRSITYNDATFGSASYSDGQMLVVALNATFNDVTFLADTSNPNVAPGFCPTALAQIDLNNVNVEHQVEWDKNIDVANINGGHYDQLLFQNTTGANTLNIFGGANVELLNNLPRKTVVGAATIGAIRPCGFNFGSPEELRMDGTTVSSWYAVSDCFNNRDDFVDSICTLGNGNGLITIPKTTPGGTTAFTYGAPKFTVPGFSYLLGYRDQFNNLKTVSVFRVLSVYDDTNNVYVQTDLTLPDWPDYGADLGATGLSIICCPVQRMYITNTDGCATSRDLSQPGAYGRGYGEYSKRKYDNTTGNPNYPNFMPISSSGLSRVPIMGALVSATITVHTAYTGGGGPLLMRFINENYPYIIDLAQPGPRVITPGGVTGAVGGDSLSAFSWFDGFYLCKEPSLNRSINGESTTVWPSVTIELIADQGIADLAVPTSRLKFRLH